MLRLEHAAAGIVAEPRPADDMFRLLLEQVGGALGLPVGSVWTAAGHPTSTNAGPVLRCASTWYLPGRENLAGFGAAIRGPVLEPDVGLPGRVWRSGRPEWASDLREEPACPQAEVAAQAGLTSGFCFPLVSRDGIEGLVEFLANEVPEPAPELLATLSSVGRRMGDALRRQRVDEEVRRSEARLRAVLDAALDCVVIADVDGQVLEFNPAACRTFGYTREEAIGRELAELIVPVDMRARHRAGLRRYLRTEQARVLDQRVEIIGMRAGGSVFPVELTITRVGRDGRPLFAGYLRDLSERHRADEELRATRRRVVEAAVAERQRLERDLHDGAQQRLVALGMTLARARTALPGDPSHAATMLDQAIRNLDEAALDLRNLARGIHPRNLTHHGLAAALADLARHSPVDLRLGMVPVVRFPAVVESTVYFVVSECLTNVARYAGTQMARVDVAVEDYLAETGTHRALAVAIADDGVGGADPARGTGLRGLADRLVMFDGRLEIISPVGGGTCVRAWIPLPRDGSLPPATPGDLSQ
ncbi:PAS domain S-box protein [Parafrankia sp. EUN1f]|uniref:PAS domain S-box protein n=1 Tax=Parafrankia sp. EUN1f TaxID=102897 RepID=UPI000A026C77|nr:PAS domain S-box protein [Parafrankia sp. EUN1f]